MVSGTKTGFERLRRESYTGSIVVLASHSEVSGLGQITDRVSWILKLGFKHSIRERSHVPLRINCKRAPVTKQLPSLPDLEKAYVLESFCEKRLPEVFKVPWAYRKQHTSQVR
jgi:hypothetical protein